MLRRRIANRVSPERMVRGDREMKMSRSLLLFIGCLLALEFVQSGKICCNNMHAKKRFELKPAMQMQISNSNSGSLAAPVSSKFHWRG